MSTFLVPLLMAYGIRTYLAPNSGGVTAWDLSWTNNLPSSAQFLDQRTFNVLNTVQPPSERNGSNLFIPPNTTAQSLLDRPFHVYDSAFLSIIGSNPTLTVVASTSGDPLFHEAVVWFPPTDEVFFVQNAGAKAAGTGLQKSAVVQKIALSQVSAALQGLSGGQGIRNVSGQVDVDVVNGTQQIVNPNGGTNYKGQIAFLGEGQGPSVAPAIYTLNPYPPYETKVILDNYWGIQFSSLNDVAVNPRNKELYFTDPQYGYFQNFRPKSALPNQVYRFNEETGAVVVVADGFDQPNGITFSPDGQKVYIADSGAGHGFFGNNFTRPATLYQYDVLSTGQLTNRAVFAHSPVGLPDGVHCDTAGNVYAGTGDGVRVWDPTGKALGEIYIGGTSANFQFAGKGRMVVCAETELYYVELNAEGAGITDYNYSDIQS